MAFLEHEALKHHEEELITCLAGLNVADVARMAAEQSLLLNKVVANIESMDPSVPRPLVYRYLLFNIYLKFSKEKKAIGKNDVHHSSVYHRLVSLLSQWRVTAGVLYQIEQTFRCLVKDENWNPAISDRSKHGRDVVVSQSFIPVLVEALADCSSRWREIAIALGLPDNEIENLNSMTHMYTPIVCLSKVLKMWVDCNYSMSKPPLLANLEKALRSQVVGLGKVASRLRVQLSCSTEESLSLHLPSRFEIIDQTPTADVAEGNCVLFEVKATTSSETALACEWFKEEENLDRSFYRTGMHVVGDNYHHFNVFILCLCAENLAAEGAYICNVRHQSTILQSEPVILRINTPIDQHVNVVTDFYEEQPEIPEDTWPPRPVSDNVFISLALVKQEGIHYAEEYSYCTIQGDVDDIYKEKQGISYEGAFANLRSGARILVEGRPGSGKTTLVHKVSRDWAKKELPLADVKVLFLVHLRIFCSKCIELTDIIKCYNYDENAVKNFVQYAKKHSGLGLCFILDGLDEYLPDDKNSFIFKLIRKQVLPKAVVIVASRPAAVAKFRPVASRQIEVLGFLKDQIISYIEKYHFSTATKYKELQKFLDLHPNVLHMCYLPLHAAMVCSLFDKLNVSLPQTETDIYKAFTEFIILRILYRYEDGVYLQSAEDLPSSQRDRYSQICKLAFEMTLSSKQAMKHTDVQSFFVTKDEKDTFGLLTIDEMAMRYGIQTVYTFNHLTFQEFLAASYIFQLEQDKQLELIVKYGRSNNMQQVWKFYCGLVKFNQTYTKFKALLQNSDYGTLHYVQCCMESQQPKTCDCVVENSKLSFSNTFLSPSNFIAIAYVIASANSNPVLELSFDNCAFSQEGVQILVERAFHKIPLISTLSYHGNSSAEQLRLVNLLMNSLPSLEVLDISDTNLGPEEVTALTENLHHSGLKVIKVTSKDNPLFSSVNLPYNLANTLVANCPNFVNICFSGYGPMCPLTKPWPLPFFLYCNHCNINLSFCKLTQIEVKVLSEDFKKNNMCTRLSLINCGLGDADTSLLFQGLCHCSNLDLLELSFNNIGDSGAKEISNKIHLFKKLRKLDLSFNKICNEGSRSLMRALQSSDHNNMLLFLCGNNNTNILEILSLHRNTDFHSLDLSNGLFDTNISMVASCMLASRKCTEVLQVNLQMNHLQDENIHSPLNVLQLCSNLLVLNISHNNLGEDGAIVLGSALKQCTKLHKLDVSHNNLCSYGAESIASGLKCCKFLLDLKLNNNCIGSEGANALAEALKNCTILQELEIASNHIGSEGVNALALSLEKCSNFYSLKVGFNNIRNIAAEVLISTLMRSALTYLHHLNIAGNHLGQAGAVALACVLQNCAHLCELDVNSTSVGSDGIATLAMALKHTKLYTLHADSNNIGSIGAKALASNLTCSNSLFELTIHNNRIGNDGAKAIAEFLRGCSSLSILDIGSNFIEYSGTSALFTALRHCTRLYHLDISFNEVGIDGGKALSQVFHYCLFIQKLNLPFCQIGSNGAKFIAESLKYCTSLKMLNVSSNDIGSHGAVSLAEALEHCPSITHLDIGYNYIGNEGAGGLAKVLDNCADLCDLNICSNDLESEGIKAISRSLMSCTKLFKLDLHNNALDWISAQAVTDTLQCCRSLTKLCMSDNSLGNDGTKLLAMALKQSTSIQELEVNSNSIWDNGAIALANALKYNSALKILCINRNSIGRSGAEALADALLYCTKLCLLDISSNVIGIEGIEVLTNSLKHCNKINAQNNVDQDY